MNHIDLIKALIRTPSFSREEEGTAMIIEEYLKKNNISYHRYENNIVAIHPNFDKNKKTVLLNSHHDTVKVNKGWTKDPFGAEMEDGKLYGLGSNDAGACLVSLIQAFLHFYNQELPLNLVLAATAEEEIFGPKGLSSLLGSILPPIDFGIIGEPTSLKMGIAEKGLIVVDATIKGVAGHAARNTGVNAIYKCISDLDFLREFSFPKVSPYLGPVTAQVSQINAGYQHNIIPDECKYVIDIRVNELYTNEEIIDILENNLEAKIKPRSMRWRSKGIDLSHPILEVAQNLDIETFGSPTLSDQMHCDFPTIKIGPGDSRRSHTPDEYILIDEISDGIETYISILNNLRI